MIQEALDKLREELTQPPSESSRTQMTQMTEPDTSNLIDLSFLDPRIPAGTQESGIVESRFFLW